MKKTTKLTISFYWDQVKQYKYLSVFMIIGLIGAIGIDLVVPFFYKNFFDILTNSKDIAKTASELTKIIFIVLGLYSTSWFFWRFIEFSFNKLVAKSMADIRNKAFKYLHQHSYAFFSGNFVGALVKKVTKLASAFEGIIGRAYWDIGGISIRIISAIAILFYVNFSIGIIMLIWTVSFILFNYFFAIYKLKFDIERSEADTKITATLADTITNNINMKIFTSQTLEEDTFAKVNENWRKKAKKTWDLGNVSDAVQSMLIIILEFFAFYISIKLWEKGIFHFGDFILIQAYIIQITWRLWDFGRTIRYIYQDFGDAEEMITILNTPHEVKDSPKASQINVTKGKIEFKDVIYGYHKTQPVIKNFNLKINPGEKIALIGPSGGGKSTIVKLLFRFFDIDKGKILIDNQNIAQVTQHSLRENLSLVPQEAVLFHRTLMDNIRYGKTNATDEQVKEAAKLANCHQFIEKFPDKYNTYVGERGIKLSGGERQRIAIARAILKNSPILILDEATSSLDSESEHLIQQALERLMKGKTTIVIAHRLSTIMKMDKIIVINNGQIEEVGTHKELTKKTKGTYKKLWEIQAGEFTK